MQNSNQLQRSGQTFKRNLSVALETGDRRGVTMALKEYKTPSGAANYPALLSVPISERLPAMAAQDVRRASMIVTAGVTMALEAMNLARPMNASQVMDLADAILETASEDQLSLEDLILFMQRLTRGQYGALYESMDSIKFMEKFEIYRQERHVSYMRIREEQHAQFKALPVNERFTEMYPDEEIRKHKEAHIQHIITTAKPQNPAQ
jgi:hypothetical protein